MDNNRIIPASELIINADGSAFHIHLRPDQLRDNIILVGDPGRVDMVASFFDDIEYDVSSREFHAIAGHYKGKEMLCISHGIGPDNIEIVVTELDALANVDFATRKVRAEHRTLNMVRIGTSGSLQEDIHIGDFVMAAKATGFDGILNVCADMGCPLHCRCGSRIAPPHRTGRYDTRIHHSRSRILCSSGTYGASAACRPGSE